MRRAKAFGLIFVLLIAAMLGCDLTQTPATPPTPISSPSPTFSLSPTPTLTTYEADLTHWAQVATITPTPAPNTPEVNQTRWAAWTATAALLTPTAASPENAQASAEAYGTAYASAPGTLEVPVDSDGLRPRVTLSEAHVNEIIAPYAAQVANVSNVYLDLVPGGAMLTATLTVLGLRIQVSATSLLVVEDGVLLTHVTSASIGGIAPPSAALEAVNNDLVPMVNSAINNVLAEYGSLSVLYITDLDVTHTDLIVEFIFLATPRPTATPTALP